MALIGNRSVLLKSPGWFLSGTVASIERSNFRTLRNQYQSFSGLSATPNGHLSPSAWILPNTGGGMSSHNFTFVDVDASGAGAEGVNIAGATELSVTAAAIGQLIASAIGAASFQITADGTIIATLGAPGSASLSISASASIEALGFLVGEATASVTASIVSYATGSMDGTAYLAGESAPVTPDNVALAVWAKVVEAGFSAEQMLRIIAAQAAGAATGLEGANPQFTGIDGTTLRIDGTYSAGTRTIDALDGS